jgi:pantetheine-phosphate adenylyltransferase
MSTTAIYAGSFDPITLGHIDIIKRTVPMFDGIYVSVGVNSMKKELFDSEERKELINLSLKNSMGVEKISVKSFSGQLLIDFARAIGANVLIRGIRSVSDFEYEINLAGINKTLAPEIETIFIPTSPTLSVVSSSAAKEIARHGGDVTKFVPTPVALALYGKLHPYYEAQRYFKKYTGVDGGNSGVIV